MALFVLGAGATRGASFVNSTKDPCLPPLDRDFFTQLQRVRQAKHKSLIRDVMRDAVELFGPNFDVTMENMFTTLEHTIRMLKTTGETRDFNRADLERKRDRLEQAIAVVLEDSLAEKDNNGKLTQEFRHCEHHDKLVKDLIQGGDQIITFNYDCMIDDSLRRCGERKWNPRYGYGFNLGARGKNLRGDQHWEPGTPASQFNTVHLYKLHGSLHFQLSGSAASSAVTLKQYPYTKRRGNLKFTVIPPEWHKSYDKGIFAKLWKDAAAAINRAQHTVFAGYSLPETDLHSTALFRTSVKKRNLRSLVVVNPDRPTRRRIRSVVQRGFTRDTRVLSVDFLREFVALDRSTWAL